MRLTSKPTLGLVGLVLATLAASAGVWLLLPPGPRAAWTGTYGVAFTPDSRTFITYDRKRGQVKLYDVASGSERAALPGYAPDATGLPINLPYQAFTLSPDGRFLATRTDQRSLRIWDMTTLEEQVTVLPGESINTEDYELSSQGRFVLLWGKAWEVTMGRWLDPDPTDEPLFSPDGKWMAFSTDRDETAETRVRNFETATEKLLLHRRGWSWKRAFSPDSRLLAVAGFSADQTFSVSVLDVDTGDKRLSLSVPPPRMVGCPGFSPDSSVLAVATAVAGEENLGSEGVITLYDVASGRVVATVATGDFPNTLSFNRNGRVLIADHPPLWSHLKHRIGRRFWDLTATPPREFGSVFPSDVPLDAEAAGDGDRSTTSPLPVGMKRHLYGDRASLDDAISPDGRLLAGCRGYEREAGPVSDFLVQTAGLPLSHERVDVKLMDVDTGRELAALPSSGKPFFSPDGKTLATDNERGSVMLWDVPPRKARPWPAALPAILAVLALLLFRWRRIKHDA